MSDYKELRKLALAATPGPWQAQQRNKQEAIYIVGPDCTPPACHAFYADNAAYIAAANPDAVLALLDEVERLHKDTARLDWLADRENAIGNVQLPTACVHANLHCMRAAIDAAMEMEVKP